VIFDTNILIYISQNILKVEGLISDEIKPQISIISYIEALGFPFASNIDKFYMEQICASCKVLPLSDTIVQQTIYLRTKYKIKLPDAIIYATAVIEQLPLMTNNTADFKLLDGKVKLINPFST
jgi:predicted nucleic acid-binding protein